MTIDPETIRLYDANKSDDIHPILAAFIAALPATLPDNSHVLDFGCGPGFDAALIAKTGAHVDAMDASTEMVVLANKQHGVTAWQASFDDLDATDKYHAILASFSLLQTAGFDGFDCHLGTSVGLDGVMADWITTLTRKTKNA
jgi:SAM-dependent methyltransferase